jgi:prophage regulatory protein
MSNHKPQTGASLLAASLPRSAPQPLHWLDNLSDSAWIREAELVRSSKRLQACTLLPFSAATLWRKVKAGTFPKPTKLSERVTAWRVGDVRAWMAAQPQA